MTVVAFLVPVPHGHSNVHLSILRHLLSQSSTNSPLTLHILSDGPLQARIASLPVSEHTSVHFHVVDNEDVFEGVAADPDLIRVPPLSLFNRDGLRSLRGKFIPIMCPSPEVYLRRYARILSVLQDVKPDLVVIDVIFAALGSDVCRTLGLRYVSISPVSSLDTAQVTQPGGRGLWKYPMLFSNVRFPVPLWQIPHNIALFCAFIFTIIFHPARRKLDAARRDAGLQGSLLDPSWKNAVCSICPSLPELEYPHVPNPRTVFAGPILTPTAPLTVDEHSDLANFLEKGRTALVNLGSLFVYKADDVGNVADALLDARARMHGRGGLQVIWKLPDVEAFAELLDKKLGPEDQRRDWIRVLVWIEPPALAVLQHPNLVTSIHHGGANSVHEATHAGVPQIILPQWYDLYTFATRVEALGHGIYANRGAETRIDAAQLAGALIRVFSDAPGEDGYALKLKAKELGLACRKAKGDERAANAVLAAARGETLEGVYY